MCTTAATLVVLGLLVFPTGYGLKCYSCKLDQQEICKDTFKKDKDVLVDCGYSECMKVVFSVKGQKLYQRTCYEGVSYNKSCRYIEQVFMPEHQKEGIKLEYCNTCEEDGCNAAPRVAGTLGVVSVGVLVMGWALARL